MKESKAAIMGTSCFPLLIRYWRELFNVWKDEVDRVYISLAPLGDYSGAKEYAKKILDHPKIKLRDEGIGWPNGMEEDAKEAKEDLLVLLHDDTFIYKKGFLEETFNKMEDKVLTPMHPIYSSQEMVETALRKKYPGIMPWKKGKEQGYSFLLYLQSLEKGRLC